ncbi:MAG: DUF2750 domain-containing protein [Fibrobacteres bacterium]|nr:DUF2750 domain-containing protein [Fibrobacterota bacterium]
MNTKKNESIIQLPAGKRYEYFIRKTADFQQIWSLRNAEGWLLLGGNTNAKPIPLWPEKIFAEYCNRVNKTECQAESIGLNDFLSKMSKILIRDNIQLAVFPNQNMSAPIRKQRQKCGPLLSPRRITSEQSSRGNAERNRMSITFRVAGELLGEVPIEAFDALYGFDALLEEKTGKYVDLYGRTILYENDIK